MRVQRRPLAAPAALAATLALVAAAPTRASEPLVVHEWGTFTSFQDADGATIPGINVDDEPVPPFVHRLKGLPIFTAGSYPASWSQGAPSCHPDVTLRLETPVLYFYPPRGFRFDQRIDVKASFNGGWLTEFFPAAASEVPGFPDQLDDSTRGSLSWRDLRLEQADAVKIPRTDAHVWLAPRKVKSALVSSADGEEAEKYLFYRGVAHLDAPIAVEQRNGELKIALRDGETRLTQFPQSWLVRVLPNGRVWYHALQPAAAGNGAVVQALPREEGAAGPSGLGALRAELASALMAQGLFADEAQAMLETWRKSYFTSEGLRIFFLLPQAWTDAHLPLSVSVPAKITRVMMGRIELISAHQRAVLAQLEALPAAAFAREALYIEMVNEPSSLTMPERSQQIRGVLRRMQDPTGSHAELYQDYGSEVPEALTLYDSLGRFRDALLGHEWRSAQDETTRIRLQRIIGKFSSCIPPGTR